MRKIINAEGQEFVPVSTDDLVLDAVPTVNSFNSVTSDAVARAVAGASGEVPQVTENDNGKILTAIYDAGGPAVEWGDAPSGLPDTTGASQGDVLSIGSTGPEWAAPSGGLPDTTGASQGDVLTVGSDGPEWAAVPQELPASLGTAGQVLTVNSGATGVEWATPSGGSGGVVMIDYTETDRNLFNAAVAGITNGQPVFVTRSPDQTFTFPAIPLVQRRAVVDGNVTYTELCFTCVCMRDTSARVEGFTLLKTATYDPVEGKTTNSYTRTSISKALQSST